MPNISVPNSFRSAQEYARVRRVSGLDVFDVVFDAFDVVVVVVVAVVVAVAVAVAVVVLFSCA